MPIRIPSYLPGKTIRIGEIARITAPGCLARSLQDFRPGGRGALHQRIHLAFLSNIVRQGNGRLSKRCWIGLEVRSELIPKKERKDHSACLKEDDFFILECRRPTQAVDIEFPGSFEALYSKGYDAYALVHNPEF